MGPLLWLKTLLQACQTRRPRVWHACSTPLPIRGGTQAKLAWKSPWDFKTESGKELFSSMISDVSFGVVRGCCSSFMEELVFTQSREERQWEASWDRQTSLMPASALLFPQLSSESINPIDLLSLVIVRIPSLEARTVTSTDADLHYCKNSWNPWGPKSSC